VVLILAYFITFAILAGWVEEGKLKVKEKFVYLAFWLAVAITLSYFVPAGIKKPLADYWGFEVQTFGRHVFRKQFREKAGEQAKESAKYFEEQIIERLRRQREDLMTKVINGAPLTEELKWEIARINQQIEEVESGALTKTPSLSQRVSSPGWAPQMPYLTWKEIVFGSLSIAFLVWVVFIRDEKKATTTSSGGTKHA
jgi:peptidoglycan hydrolase CwlO-like protein